MTTRTRSRREDLVRELLVERYERFAGGWAASTGLREWLSERATAVCDGPPEVERLLAASVRPRRLAIDSPYPVHAHAPSPRGREWNPTIVRLGTVWHLVDRASGRLRVLPGAEPVDADGADTDAPDTVTVVSLFDPAGLPSLYDDFGYVLSLLEAGHAAFQLASEAARLGRPATLRVVPTALPGVASGAIALVAVDIGGWLGRTPSPSSSSAPAMIRAAGDDAYGRLWREQVSSPALGALLDDLDEARDPGAASTGRGTFALPAVGVFSTDRAHARAEAEARRTSAQSTGVVSFLGAPLSDGERQHLVREARDTVAVLPDPSVDVSWGMPDARGDWRWQRSDGAPETGPRRPDGLLRDLGSALRGCSWIAVITWPATGADDEGADFALGLLSAGILAQAVCVAAAGIGHAAHPMRGIDERSIAAVSPTRFPVYLIAGGIPSMTPTRFDLDA